MCFWLLIFLAFSFSVFFCLVRGEKKGSLAHGILVDMMVLYIYLYVFNEFLVSLSLKEDRLVMVSERGVSLADT